MQAVIIIQLLGIAVLIGEIIYLFTRNESRMQIILLIMSVCVLVNFVGETGEILSTNPESAIMGVRFSYLGKPFILFTCLLFLIDYCRVRVPRGILITLFCIHLAISILAFTCPYHQLFYTSIEWTETGLFPHLILGKSILYWTYSNIVGLYLLFFIVLIIRQLKHSKTDVERKQAYGLLAMIIIMFVSFFLFIIGVTNGYDSTLVGYTVTIIILVRLILHFNLFETITLAREKAVQDSEDGLVVLDQRGDIIYVNSVAASVLDMFFRHYAPSGIKSVIDTAYRNHTNLFKRQIEKAPDYSPIKALENDPTTYKPLYEDNKLIHVYDEAWTDMVVGKLSELANERKPVQVKDQYYQSRKRELIKDDTPYGCIFELKNVTESYTYATRLEEDVEAKTKEIRKIQREITISFANMVEARDGVTGAHIKNTSTYVDLIVTAFQAKVEERAENDPQKIEELWGPGYLQILEPTFKEILVAAAPLHDLGKISVPDAILSKPGKLTDEEFKAMQAHTIKGAQVIESTLLGIESDYYVEIAKQVALSHHEKWNGQGYPFGLAGTEIPLSARIMAIADVYDALRSPRSYKSAFTPQKAQAIIREDSGSHFDPVLVSVFLEAIEELDPVQS